MSKNSVPANTPDNSIAQPWINSWQALRDGQIFGWQPMLAQPDGPTVKPTKRLAKAVLSERKK